MPEMTEAERLAKLAELDALAAQLRAAAPPPPWAQFIIDRIPAARWTSRAVVCPGAGEHGAYDIGVLLSWEAHALNPARGVWLRALADLADAIERGAVPRPERDVP